MYRNTIYTGVKEVTFTGVKEVNLFKGQFIFIEESWEVGSTTKSFQIN